MQRVEINEKNSNYLRNCLSNQRSRGKRSKHHDYSRPKTLMMIDDEVIVAEIVQMVMVFIIL